MTQLQKNLLILATIIIGMVVISGDLFGQCPMCKMSAESNLKDGGTAGKGLNNGILYMLAMPYLLVMTIGLLWWKNRKKLSDDIYDQPYSDN